MNVKFKLYFIIIISGLFLGRLFGQVGFSNWDYTLPGTFLKEGFHAGPQFFQGATDHYGRVFYSNTEGVFYFDGDKWRLVEGTKNLENPKLKSNNNGTVFLAGGNEFGIVSNDRIDKPYFTSLTSSVDSSVLDNFKATHIGFLDGQVFFCSSQFLLMWSDQKMKLVHQGNRIRCFAQSEGELIIWDNEVGLLRWADSLFQPIPNSVSLIGENVKGLFKIDDYSVSNRFLIVTMNNGLLEFNGESLTPLDSKATPWLRNCLSATSLPDGNIAVSSYGEGLLILDSKGQLLQKYDQSNGLPDNLVIDVWHDGKGSLWMGLNKGLARMNYPTDYSQYDARLGLDDPVVSMAWLGDRLFAASSGLVYEKVARIEDGYPEYFRAWNIFPYNINHLHNWRPANRDQDRLLLVDNNYLYDWDGNAIANGSNLKKLELGAIGKRIVVSKRFPGRVYVGATGAVFAIDMEPQMRIVSKIELEKTTVNNLLEDESGQVWAADEVVIRIPMDQDGMPGTPVKLDSLDGWKPEMGFTGLVHWDRGVTFRTEVGLYFWDDKAGKIKAYPEAHNPWAGKNVWIFEPWGKDRVFVMADNIEGLAVRDASGDWSWDTIPSRSLPFTVFRDILPENDSILWAGTDDGIFRYNTRHQKDYRAPFQVLLRSASIGQDSLLRLDGGEVALSPSYNDIQFAFTSTEMERPDALRFRYRMLGYQDSWSSWTDRRFAEYTNLAGGDYTFEVMARNIYGTESEVVQYRFQVATPWHLRWWAFVLYALLGMALIWWLLRLRVRSLIRARDRLEGLVVERTREIEAQKDIILQEKQETEKQKERAEESERVKKRFFANMTHELRTPLTLILGPVNQLKSGLTDPGSHEQLNLVERNGKKLLRLINQLLDIAKIESERMELHPVRRDMAAFVEEAISNFVPAARQKGIVLNAHTPENPLMADFDPEKIEKILFNLLSNAIKFTEGGERVDLRLSARNEEGESWMELEVSDGGAGIAQEDLPHVFDRFYQSDQIRSSRGTGIGLALCKELVELHGGSIAVKSTLGKGSTFSILLPLSQSQVREEGTMPETPGSADLYLADADAPSSLSQLDQEQITSEDARNVVLVVEDNDDVRAYIRSCIPDTYQVMEARNGRQGLEMALKWVPDLVLSDLMMPEMDGIEMTAQLKKEEASSHIPVIMLTSRAESDARLEGLETGADAYLTKPFNPAELQIRIQKLIELRQTLRDKYRGEMLLGPQKVEATSMEESFLLKVQELIRERLGDEQLAVADMAEAVGLSQVQFNRKFKALTGNTPNKFLRKHRLDVAKQLIEQNAGTMAEIGFQVGFRSAAYFSKCFMDEFGMSPSEVRQSEK